MYCKLSLSGDSYDILISVLVAPGASRGSAVFCRMSDNKAAEPNGSKTVPGKVHFSYSGRQGSVRVATELLAGKASRHALPSLVVAGRHKGRGSLAPPLPPADPFCLFYL